MNTFYCCHCRMSFTPAMHYEKPDVAIQAHGHEHPFALCLQCWITLAKQLTTLLKKELSM